MESGGPQNLKDGLERISIGHMFSVMLSIWNLEKGLLFSLKQLTTQPGEGLKDYLFRDRSRYVHPLRFLFFSTALAAFVNTQFIFPVDEIKEGMEQGIRIGQEDEEEDEAVTGNVTFGGSASSSAQIAPSDSVNISSPSIEGGSRKVSKKELASIISSFFVDFYTRYQNLLLLMLVPIQAFFTWLFFRKSKFYFGEHLAINAFISSYVNVGYLLIAPFTLIDGFEWMMGLYLLVSVAYTIVAYVQVYDRQSFGGTFRAIISYGAGFVVYMILVFGLVIFLINRYIDANNLG